MKKITKLFMAIAFFALATNLNAQLSVGARVGVNLSDLVSTAKSAENQEYESITGLMIIIPIEIGITEAFSVQPELSFIQKGAGLQFSLLGATVTSNSIYNHFEVPILLKYKFINSETFQLYAAVGPGFSYALSGRVGTPDAKLDIDFESDELKDFKRFDTNINFGVGCGFNVGSGDIILDLRYRYGITDLDNSDEITNKSHNLGLSVGYMYTLGQ